MTKKIASEIVGFDVVKPEAQEVVTEAPNNVVQMHEKLERPEVLKGSTYKIATPLSDHALYVTINDIVLNADTEHELRRPFEIFINSKNIAHFQWIVALTRIMSAVFRKGGDINFLVEELHSVFDPAGGYFNKGKFTCSLVAEIGDVLESHLKMIGMLKDESMDEHRKKLVKEKRASYERRFGKSGQNADADFPEGAALCVQCNAKAVIRMDGCLTCLSCGESKCS